MCVEGENEERANSKSQTRDFASLSLCDSQKVFFGINSILVCSTTVCRGLRGSVVPTGFRGRGPPDPPTTYSVRHSGVVPTSQSRVQGVDVHSGEGGWEDGGRRTSPGALGWDQCLRVPGLPRDHDTGPNPSRTHLVSGESLSLLHLCLFSSPPRWLRPVTDGPVHNWGSGV